MIFKRESYVPWWEDDIVQSFEDEGEEVCLIVKQGIFSADALPHEDISFPWHGKTEIEFERLHAKMRESLADALSCKSIPEVIRFKKKYPEVYRAYFKVPIQFQDEISLVGDGRHRIYIAQKLKSVVPAWKVEYKKKKETTFEEYRKYMAYGEWRFLTTI